jgi:hypothetical protein
MVIDFLINEVILLPKDGDTINSTQLDGVHLDGNQLAEIQPAEPNLQDSSVPNRVKIFQIYL